MAENRESPNVRSPRRHRHSSAVNRMIEEMENKDKFVQKNITDSNQNENGFTESSDDNAQVKSIEPTKVKLPKRPLPKTPCPKVVEQQVTYKSLNPVNDCINQVESQHNVDQVVAAAILVPAAVPVSVPVGPVIMKKQISDTELINKRKEDNIFINSDSSDYKTNKMGTIRRIARRVTQEIACDYDAVEMATLRKKVEYTPESDEFYSCDGDTILDSFSSDKYKEDECITIKKFNDYRPQNKHYFYRPKGVVDDSEKDGIAVVIPFFNEPSHELQQTLNSLYDGFLELRKLSKTWRDKRMYVCLIQDGWNKADKSMKEYLQDMFPKKINDKGWWETFDELTDLEKTANPNATFIIERVNYLPSMINTQTKFKEEGQGKFMKITLVIKANNRRKHNSHEWFLGRNGFADATNAKYLFLTDAFTLYSHSCLYYLVKDLDRNSSLSGVTGRQRLMTRNQQGSGESFFSFGYVLRNLQLFDFELANCVYNGAFSLDKIGGMLPVVPGPLGLYRARCVLQDNVRDSYFKVVNEEPHKTGLILGNLRIAEDRVLSCYSVTKTEEKTSTSFNPLAVFYFEAETNLEKLVLQRRRWINGSVAGYIYLLFVNFADFKNWNASILKKIYIWLLLFCQFLIYCMVGIAPGISIKILYFGINYFLSYYGINWELQLLGMFVVVWAIYIAHIVVHYRERFNYLIWYLLVFLSALTSITSYASIIHYFLTLRTDEFMEIVKSGSFIIFLAIFVIFVPFFLSLCLSGRGHSFLYMVRSFIYYMLFLPLFIAWFGSYAYARTWDLTWGNRPSNELTDITPEQRTIMVTKFKEKSIRIVVALAVLNIIVFFLPLQGIYAVMTIFFLIVLFQMFMSFIFCIGKIWYKVRMSYKRLFRKKDYINLDSEV